MSYTTDLAYYKIKQLEGENEELRKKCTYFENLSTERFKAIEELHQQLDAAEKEINELKKQNYTLGEKCQAETKAREHWRQLCNERGDRIRSLEMENKDLKAKTDNALAFHKIMQLEETNARLIKEKEDLTLKHKDAVFVDLDSVKLKGMEELWAMLGNMFDVDHIEVMKKIFGCLSINNIAHYTPDVREFLEKYEVWKRCAEEKKKEKEEQQKRLDYMRDYLHRFCVGKVCYGCPLNTPEFKCYVHGGFDSISDEDLKRYYEKARNCIDFRGLKKKEEKSSDEVPCSFNWKLDGTEFTIETSIPRADYDNIVKIISGKE